MSDPKHDLYEAVESLPFDLRQALDSYGWSNHKKGVASCLEEQAHFRTKERPHNETRKKEYEAASQEVKRICDVVIRTRDEVARAILAALAEAKKR